MFCRNSIWDDWILTHWGQGEIDAIWQTTFSNAFKCIFLNENELISLRISRKFFPKVQINNIPSLVQIMAWRLPGDKSLSETMMVSLLPDICVTRPQWVKEILVVLRNQYFQNWLDVGFCFGLTLGCLAWISRKLKQGSPHFLGEGLPYALN